ncbi:MAG: MGMT family protein [Clostridium sp.]|jgi:methylated-DNA-protein-cysteine methyltransferase-like protein|nr:MGMT family protein [Clostridium sp.]
MNAFEQVYQVVRQIPCGKVATYGQIAVLAGHPRWARVVGYALHVNPDPAAIPCHRVVNRLGCCSRAFAFGGVDTQRILLEGEGVGFTEDGRVEMEKYQWELWEMWEPSEMWEPWEMWEP